MRSLRVVTVAVIALLGGVAPGAEETQVAPRGVDEMAMLAVQDPGVNLSLSAPLEAGDKPGPVSDDNTWLNYTSTVDPEERIRSITVALDGVDEMPSGTVLEIEATSVAGAGGDTGSPAGPILLSSEDQDIVTGIGTGYTGTGSSGARIRYTFKVNDISQLTAGSDTVTIVYTLTPAD